MHEEETLGMTHLLGLDFKKVTESMTSLAPCSLGCAGEVLLFLCPGQASGGHRSSGPHVRLKVCYAAGGSPVRPPGQVSVIVQCERRTSLSPSYLCVTLG